MESSSTTVVTGKDGLRGRIEATAPEAGTHHVLIRLEDGRQVMVPEEALTLQEDGSFYLPFTPADLAAEHPPRERHTDVVLTMPVLSEELHVEKRQIEIGRTRIVKTVKEHEEIVNEPLMHEEVTIERVPIQRVWEGPPPAVRYEGDTIVIPLLEEVLVVEKRLLVKEELHIRRRQTVVQEPQKVTLRTEEVSLQHLDSNTPPDHEDRSRESATKFE